MDEFGSECLKGIERINLSQSSVNLWGIDLDAVRKTYNFNDLVSHEEQRRSLKFADSVKAERFLAGRAAIRMIIGHYLSRAPKAIEFKINSYGRPSLLNSALSLDFNFSRSRARAVLGIVKKGRIGVDLEHHFDDPSFFKTAQIILCEAEMKEFSALQKSDFNSYLLATWTKKEAILKALGTGLSVEPSHLNILGSSTEKQIFIKGKFIATMELHQAVPWSDTLMTIALERYPPRACP